jgi:hypothetical protein
MFVVDISNDFMRTVPARREMGRRDDDEGLKPYQCVDHVSIEAVLNTKNVRENASKLFTEREYLEEGRGRATYILLICFILVTQIENASRWNPLTVDCTVPKSSTDINNVNSVDSNLPGVGKGH